MKKYRVYFEQINQTMYLVEADNEDEALSKAKSEWMATNGIPGGYVEEDEE